MSNAGSHTITLLVVLVNAGMHLVPLGLYQWLPLHIGSTSLHLRRIHLLSGRAHALIDMESERFI